tara:strand:+ start:219 stop:1091 length:873 start_codon:yes stop_codon:yes gene_type:complete
MLNKCKVCNKKNFEIVWNDKIRSGKNNFTKKKEIIFRCLSCDLVFLKNRRKNLENSAVARSLYNKNNSIKEFLSFHKPRELKKLNFFKKYISFKNKNILESNCGAGILLATLKNGSKSTSGIDDNSYKDYLNKNGHNFFPSFDRVIQQKKKFDIILSLSELEHKYDPTTFLKKMKKALSKSGRIILRVPNYHNVYSMLLGNSFYKYDYRTSHNYYFSCKNLTLLIKKVGLKIEKKIGLQEYDFNHLLQYLRSKKRVTGPYKKVLSYKNESIIKKNIENSFTSTSLVYILN